MKLVFFSLRGERWFWYKIKQKIRIVSIHISSDIFTRYTSTYYFDSITNCKRTVWFESNVFNKINYRSTDINTNLCLPHTLPMKYTRISCQDCVLVGLHFWRNKFLGSVWMENWIRIDVVYLSSGRPWARHEAYCIIAR